MARTVNVQTRSVLLILAVALAILMAAFAKDDQLNAAEVTNEDACELIVLKNRIPGIDKIICDPCLRAAYHYKEVGPGLEPSVWVIPDIYKCPVPNKTTDKTLIASD
jgi:hypothetical protein